jgi:phage terminase small subunit
VAGRKNADGLTLKQLNFCRAYVETGNASEAYRRSYNVSAMKAVTIGCKAQELMANGAVTVYIAALKAAAAARHEITMDDLVDELSEARAVAKEERNPAAMVAATMGKAKMLGMLVDRSSISFESRVREMTDDELRASIAKIIPDFQG